MKFLFKTKEPKSHPTAPADTPVTVPPIFVVGTGRCGTHYFNQIMQASDSIYPVHMDSMNLDADSFFSFSLWNDLPIDSAAIRRHRHKIIAACGQAGKIYFESNVYMSLAAQLVHEWYGAQCILLIRRPQDVVNSHFVKGWYEDEYFRDKRDLIPGFSPDLNANHFFGRLLPKGDEYERWSGLTRIGKISWWVNALNLEVLKLFEKMPKNSYRIQQVESLDYEAYEELYSNLNVSHPLTQRGFDKIKNSRPGKGKKIKRSYSWSTKEWSEFIQETKTIHEVFGYTACKE